MGICSSKKAVQVKDVEFSSIAAVTVNVPGTEVQTSRFEKVKIHAQSQKDPLAIVDEDVDSEGDENGDQQEDSDDEDSVIVENEDQNKKNGEESEDEDDPDEDYANEEAIRGLIQQLASPNLNLIEQYVARQKNHDLYATQTTIIVKAPNELTKDYEKIPNRLHVPDSMANSRMNPNITVPSQPNTSLGLVGLYNLGNTCFINTAVQCLSACQPLSDYFINNLHQEEVNIENPMSCRGDMSKAYGKLVKLIWNDNSHTKIYPIRFCKTIEKWAPHFVNGSQQDTQEFISYLLDCLHEDLNRAYQQNFTPSNLFSNIVNNNVSFDGKQNNSLSIQQKKPPRIPQPSVKGEELSIGQKRIDEEEAMESWKNYLAKNKSVIVDLFQGQLKSTVQCLACGFKSTKFDCLMYLSVPIAQKVGTQTVGLQECMAEYTKQETLDNQNKWFCEKCKKHQPAIKKIDIWKLPSILIVCLKRFKFLGRNKYLKIDELVNFPLNNLDLSPYVSSPQREKPIYDLFAVANHEGTMTQGHYFAYSWNHASRNWYYFNDQDIKLIKNLQKIVSPEAYILFYSKTSNENFLRQTLRIPDYWPHVVAAAAKSALIQVKGNTKRSKIQRKKIKQQIESLKSSLSSFAQSGGFLTSQQQSDIMMQISKNSNTMLGFNRSTLTGFNKTDAKKKKKKGKKNAKVDTSFKNSLDPIRNNLLLNQSFTSNDPNQKDVQNNLKFNMNKGGSTTPTENKSITNIMINNEIHNSINNIFFTPQQVVIDNNEKRAKKLTKKSSKSNQMNEEAIRKAKIPQKQSHITQKQTFMNQQAQLHNLDAIANDHPTIMHIDNDSQIESFNSSLNNTGQFGGQQSFKKQGDGSNIDSLKKLTNQYSQKTTTVDKYF